MVRNRRIYLLLGILFLVTAIILRVSGTHGLYFYLPLAVGVTFKILFVAASFRAGKMKMGMAMYLLLFGLTLFFTALYLKHQLLLLPFAEYLFYVAIACKTLSVVLFIKGK
jgi:hypothetical protein